MTNKVTNRKTEFKRVLNILRPLYFFLKILAILVGFASIVLIFSGILGDTETGFLSFLAAKATAILVGIVLGFVYLALIKCSNYVNDSIIFLELELAKLDAAKKEAEEKEKKNDSFLEDLWNYSLPSIDS